MKKAFVAFFASVGALVVIVAIVGYVVLSVPDIQVEPRVVSKDDIIALVSCMKADTCLVRRHMVSAEGRQFQSVKVVTEQGVEIRYLLGGDDSIRVMLTVKDNPVLIEDYGLTGMVRRITELSNKKPFTFELGDPDFKTRFPVAQHIYYRAMEEAKQHVIPNLKNQI